jgi:transcriptional regulator with XRE-family HTH domain
VNLTPSICRSARALLGWTIEQLSEASDVGISTIISFEAGQRVPIRANLAVLERALTEGGVMFVKSDAENGRGVKLTRSTEALRDLLLIGELKEPLTRRIERATKRITRFCEEARSFYDDFGGSARDNAERVRSDRVKLTERVDQEIAVRARLKWDTEATRFLEPLADLLHAKR